ncbi:helix-turn-helix domain-containing protein [Bacillus wiedmannii]|uniref:helix-turn-helix domain-containing protein n=1 Tax=Bacillus wiedmannii TaxID=1890302 RepID=UPI0034CF9292
MFYKGVLHWKKLQKIAEKIYKDRKFYNISQAQLCEGICTKSYLSSLENNKIAPNPLVTNLLLERLNQFKDKSEIIDYNIKNSFHRVFLI